jgi:hypothetical protein
VVEHPRRRVVDEREQRGDERRIRGPLGVGGRGGDAQQLLVVEEAPRGRDVERAVEL